MKSCAGQLPLFLAAQRIPEESTRLGRESLAVGRMECIKWVEGCGVSS